MSLPETIRAMRAAGVPDNQIIETVLAIEEERLAKGRARVAKCRENNKDRNVTRVTRVTPVTQKERSPTPPKEKLLPPDNSPTGNISTPRSELLAVLDAERAQAVVDHRKRLRKPLTPHAAKLLAAKLAKVGDPNANADLMIERGWQGFEPDWVNGRGNGPPGDKPFEPTGPKRSFAEIKSEMQGAN